MKIKYKKSLLAVILILIVAVIINRKVFLKESVVWEDCRNSKCQVKSVFRPDLSNSVPFFHINEIFKDKKSGIYRLSFYSKADKDSWIYVKYDSLSSEVLAKKIEIKASSDYVYHELPISFPGDYSNLLFEKENWKDGANIFLSSANVSLLNIENEASFGQLRPTVLGSQVQDKISQQQTNYSGSFPIDEKNISFGQVFQANENYISGVTFRMDVAKSFLMSSHQYILSLKEVDYDGEKITLSGNNLASLNFSVFGGIEKYREEDGDFFFPLTAFLEKGKYYFVGLDNSRVDTDPTDSLAFRGSKSEKSYESGTAAIIRKGAVSKVNGNLYFEIHTIGFETINGERLLYGSRIEDLGNGKGSYVYRPRGQYLDILDIDSCTATPIFNEEYKVITAENQNNNTYIYKFYTGYPINNFSLSAEKVRGGWKDVNIYYSLDKINWTEIPFTESSEDQSPPPDNQIDIKNNVNNQNNEEGNSEKEVFQIFNFSAPVSGSPKEMFLKVTYDPKSKLKSRYFGIKNLTFSAEFNYN